MSVNQSAASAPALRPDVVRPPYRLFLDDERMPARKDNDMFVVRSYDDAVFFIEARGCPTFISFDHDLGSAGKTGFDLARWLVERDLDLGGTFIPKDFAFEVHSQNPIGAQNIRAYLISYLEHRKRTAVQ